MSRHRGIPFGALASALACAGLLAVAGGRPASGASPPRPESVTGTIFRIDPGAGTLELLTGVGHSLRVRRVAFSASLRVRGRGADMAVSALVPGVVCRAECEATPAGWTATSVDVLRPAPAGAP